MEILIALALYSSIDLSTQQGSCSLPCQLEELLLLHDQDPAPATETNNQGCRLDPADQPRLGQVYHDIVSVANTRIQDTELGPNGE